MANFVEESAASNISKFCDDSDPALLIANELKEDR